MSNLGVFVTLSMLFSIWLRILLPVFSSHSVELDPGHTHIVLGAKNAQDVEQALFAHQHGNGQQQVDEPSAAGNSTTRGKSQGGLQVVSLATSQDAQVSIFAVDAQVSFLPGFLTQIMPPDGLWQALSHIFNFPMGISILPQDPPPEFSA
jgi:hypothetical protein